MTQAIDDCCVNQLCEKAWNFRPSVGTWLQPTALFIDTIDGKFCWSAFALAQIPSDDRIAILQARARDLPVAALARVHQFLLCLPPRTPTGWTRTHCATCLAKFESRKKLFNHLRKFDLLDRRSCMLNSEERFFWASLPSDEFVEIARTVADLGVGYRFLPYVCTWLEAANDTNELCTRLSCLCSLDSNLALPRKELAEWFKRYVSKPSPEIFWPLLAENLKDDTQLFVLELTAETPSLLHSFVITLLRAPHSGPTMRTLLKSEGVTLVGVIEGILEAATVEVSSAIVHEYLPQCLNADFRLIARLASMGGDPQLVVRLLQVIVKLLQDWSADEGDLVDFMPVIAQFGKKDKKLFHSIITSLCAKRIEGRLRTLLSGEDVSLAYITEGVLEAATHDICSGVVREQLPPLLTAEFGLVTRLMSAACQPGMGVLALPLVTKLLRAWHADEGSVLTFVPTLVQSLGASLPVDPGASALSALIRCLSRRSADVLNQLVAEDIVVSSVVNLLFRSMDRNTRQLPLVVELALAIIGDEDEGYEERLSAFSIWGITETELQLPGQTRDNAPVFLLDVGEDVLRSTLPKLLAANVASLKRGKFKVKFSEGIGADYGGLRRAFLARAGAQLCTSSLNLLLPAERGHFQLSPMPGLLGSQDLKDNPESWCRFLGRLFGLAVVHDEPLGLLLVPSLCKSLAGSESCFSDLQFVDASYYRSLSSLSRGPMLGERLPSETVDEILDGQKAECTSKPAFIFDTLVAHIDKAGDFKIDLAEMLLKAAATNTQRAAAVRAATDVVQYSSTDEQKRLLATACCMPNSREVEQFIALLRSQDGIESIDESSLEKADTCFSSDAASVPPLPQGLERATSTVHGCGINAGEPLTSRNIDNFRDALTKKLLLDNLQPHLGHVCDEFRAVIGASKQSKTWEEIQVIIAGAPVDVCLWRRLTNYSGGHSIDSDVVTWWWDLLEERGDLFRRRVFTFATGYASMPPNGVRFTMHCADDETRLPTSSTCTSTLILPAYSSRQVLLQKLEWALTEEGFYLV